MKTSQEEKVSLTIDIAIKLGVLTLMLYTVYLIAKPFLAVTAWGIIIAIAVTPLINLINKNINNRKAIIIGFTLVVISMLIIPAYMLSQTAIESSQNLVSIVKNGDFVIPPANEEVKSWPLIGESAYQFWNDASHNLKTTLEPFSANIQKVVSSVLIALGSGLGTIVMFSVSLAISAVFLLNAKSCADFYRRFLQRLIGQKANEWTELSTLTIRSVVNGVIGVAVIQSFFAFIGFALIDLPLALVWALVLMFLTIIQLPSFIIIAPAIAYVFFQGTGISEIIFAVYITIVGISDNFLKPLLMGRGIKIPVLVILIGAIGGMILMGMIGLFIGAVVFALAYELFLLWINEQEEGVS